MKKGVVYLIGAGPGDPKLITVKGLECIKKADVVVYDRLANPKLLHEARPDAEYIFVGKSPERHAMRQEQINQLLVDLALDGKIVARLKGGDPFVFGRGGEEAELLVENQVDFEIVPGITSAISVPAYAGIPVTHRDFTATFTVITGHEDPTKDDTKIQWDSLATRDGTLVFLMGMENLPRIVSRLITNGKKSTTPVAVIRWGTRPEQEAVTGTLETIEEIVNQAGLTSPAIIIVGEVVTLREKLAWFEKKPLFGKRILVTRSREQASVLSEKIEALGGEAWEFPTIDIKEPEDFSAMDQAIQNLENYQWIIFTSVNGVKYFFARLNSLNTDIRKMTGVKLCAIGPKTKEELENRGMQVTYIPSEYQAEAIVEGLQSQLNRGDKILLPRADIARKVLPEELVKLGCLVDDVVAYHTVRGTGNIELLVDLFEQDMIHGITFTSSSTVHNLVELIGKDRVYDLVKNSAIFSIGPITSETAEKLDLNVDITAKEFTIDGLVDAITDYYVNK